jgi:hypothetical protein
MRKPSATLIVSIALGTLTLPVSAELGSDVPSDAQLLTERVQEAGPEGSGIFDIAVPPAGTVLQPVKGVPREKYGLVGPFPLQLQDLPALLYPDATLSERQELLEGLTFFTTPHTAAEGLGPINNQKFCLGCHLNTAEGGAQPWTLEPEILYSRIYLRIQCRASRAIQANKFRVHVARPRHWRRQPGG